MHLYECAICGAFIERAMVCKMCRPYKHEEWARGLIEIEKRRRNMLERDYYHGTVEMSVEAERLTNQLGNSEFDLADIIDQDSNVMGSGELFDPFPEYDDLDWSEWELIWRCENWAQKAHLTKREVLVLILLALLIDERKPSSEEGSHILSKLVGKRISAQAYRQTLTTLRRKLRKLNVDAVYLESD